MHVHTHKHMFSKIGVLLSLSSLFLFCGCGSPLVGDGVIQDKEIKIQDFKELVLSGSFRVIITSEQTPKLRVESYANLIDNLNIEQKGNKLIIEEKKSVQEGVICNIFIGTKSLEYLKLNDNVTIDQPTSFMGKQIKVILNDSSKLIANVETVKLNLTMNDQSQCNLKGNCLEMEMELNDDAQLIAHYLNIESANVQLNDRSLAEILVLKKLIAKAYDEAQLLYAGSPSLEIKTKQKAVVKSKSSL